jgi:nucleotide-binding universal stress UspA family protein
MMNSPETIIAVTSDEPRHRKVLDRAAAVATETGATVILFDLDADLGPFESPLPTEWSAEGEEEEFSSRLSPPDLEAAGQAALADRVRALRAAGVKAFGWLPPKADGDELARYAQEQNADVVVLSAEDADLIDHLKAKVEILAVPAD